jgi:hypothetical protein
MCMRPREDGIVSPTAARGGGPALPDGFELSRINDVGDRPSVTETVLTKLRGR